MATIEGQPALVIIGSWNPAILNPKWIADKIFEKPDGEEMLVRMEFATSPGLPPQYTLGDISFVPSNERLILSPQDLKDESLQLVEGKAIRVLKILSHTPVVAFGQNFDFIETEPSDELLSDFTEVNRNAVDHVDEQKELITSTIVTSYESDGCVLNFTRVFSRGSMSLKFNFHYDVVSADEAAEKMNGAYVNNLALVRQILANYNTEINDIEEAVGA